MAQTYSSPTGDFVTSTLVGAITAGSTSATIGSSLTIPATNGILEVDYDSLLALGVDGGPETITYTAYNSGTGALTGITRATAGTTAVAHANTASVQAAPSSLYIADLYAGNIATGTSSVGLPAAAVRLEGWASWTPSYTGFSANPTATAKYLQIGKTVFAHYEAASSGTSNATSKTVSLPVAAKNAFSSLVCTVKDNGTIKTTPGSLFTGAASATASVFVDTGQSTTWTASSTCSFSFDIVYEAN